MLLQAAQNKCIRSCLKPDDGKSITVEELEKTNFLPIQKKVNQWTLCFVYKFYAKKASGYMDEIFSHAQWNRIPTCYFCQKLKLLHCIANQGLRVLSHIGPSSERNLDKSLKTSTFLKGYSCCLSTYYFV